MSDDPDLPEGCGVVHIDDFADRLAALCAHELSEARNDAERPGQMIERLGNALGMTIAHAAGGNGGMIDQMCEGAEGYVYRAAVDHAPLAVFMGECRKSARMT